MKTKSQELGITQFPYFEWCDMGSLSYYEQSDGYWEKYKNNCKGELTYYEDSVNEWKEYIIR